MSNEDAARALQSQNLGDIRAQVVEGRPPSRAIEIPKDPHVLIFDAEWYGKRYPDVAAAGMNPVQHFLEYGGREDRDPNPFFSAKRYRTRYRDVAASGMNPFLHYLFYGLREGREPQPPDQVEAIQEHSSVVVGSLSAAASSIHALPRVKKPDGRSGAKKARTPGVKAPP